jgi:hypothetical protein
MSDAPINPPSWAFQPNEDGWVLNITNQVGSIQPTERGTYIATLNDDWQVEFSDLDFAMYSMKNRLAIMLRNKATELNFMADNLQAPKDVLI